MRGGLWIEKNRGLTASTHEAESVGALVAACAVGVAASLLAARVQLHLGLPGHKALALITPVVAARLVFGSTLGATGGLVAAALASLAAGGNAIGAASHLPLAGLAGAILDAAIGLAERRRLAAGWTIALAGLAGLAANLVFWAERMLGPLFQWHAFLGVPGLPGRALSYAFFGLVAGLAGAWLGELIARRNRAAQRP